MNVVELKPRLQQSFFNEHHLFVEGKPVSFLVQICLSVLQGLRFLSASARTADLAARVRSVHCARPWWLPLCGPHRAEVQVSRV